MQKSQEEKKKIGRPKIVSQKDFAKLSDYIEYDLSQAETNSTKDWPQGQVGIFVAGYCSALRAYLSKIKMLEENKDWRS